MQLIFFERFVELKLSTSGVNGGFSITLSSHLFSAISFSSTRVCLTTACNSAATTETKAENVLATASNFEM